MQIGTDAAWIANLAGQFGQWVGMQCGQMQFGYFPASAESPKVHFSAIGGIGQGAIFMTRIDGISQGAVFRPR
jgi:hypothetical protein